jgi:RHH-type proline utilization regulon transcriptional repressor/proline dehydrogenase/delta 1-pyrroline-5-carboxylate dehydrogenase
MTLTALRDTIRAARHTSESVIVTELLAQAPDAAMRARSAARGAELVRAVRSDANPGLMEVFLAEYGLSTQEGIALMCLAEALLRVPDRDTIDALIEDKIAPAAWGAHLGRSSSSLVNASTWALMLTGRVLRDSDGPGLAAVLQSAVKRLGEPVIRTAVARAMKELGGQFVLGETIDAAVRRGRDRASNGYTYSYDMLGEAAMTAEDAARYHAAYAGAIRRLGAESNGTDIRGNPGISIKLSALHPRYEVAQAARVMAELVPATLALARLARDARMGLNIDAEEADRLDLSLDVIAAVLADPSLAGWDGFGVVVQAYGKRAGAVIDWLGGLAAQLDRRIMVRLVKGAYWDTEVKRAQVDGLDTFPVFTAKPATDVNYLVQAGRLLGMTDRIYPQFATHNAHTVAAILDMADAQGIDRTAYEFQRLHGMGEALHEIVRVQADTRCRIYAPVGAHRDLLAYLVRRLLENGANSSFVNQVVDGDIAPEQVAADPVDTLRALGDRRSHALRAPADLFVPDHFSVGRRNARGWDLRDPRDLADFDAGRAEFRTAHWVVGPMIVGMVQGGATHVVVNPADAGDVVGEVRFASPADVAAAQAAARVWDAPVATRATVLKRAADLYEANAGEIFALLAREAGKSPRDAVAELREAVDFLRYYAAEARGLTGAARGRIVAISPWNFPLAIFTGQVAAALATGSAVLAKPAEATGLIAARAVAWLHQAGVPVTALQFLPGTGGVVGSALVADAAVGGVVFTGSTATAQAINRQMAHTAPPAAMLIAETGGLNAMIVDSTALPEQAVRDILASAFQSAGQRCSALRCLYLQQDIAADFQRMLFGAMDELRLGNPWAHATDVGPVIDARAKAGIAAHVAKARAEGRVIHELTAPDHGHFIAPTVIRVGGIADLGSEVFGPILHLATYRAADLPRVLRDINASGYGLTFGLHTRIDARVAEVTDALAVGNIYVNRNQIGAVVGSQPFGGEGLSGTGPKAGGPQYLPRFMDVPSVEAPVAAGKPADLTDVQRRLDQLAILPRGRLGVDDLPGPTGESNRLTVLGRGTVLCLGPSHTAALEQVRIARDNGCQALAVCPGAAPVLGIDGVLPRGALAHLAGVDLVALWSDAADLRATSQALAARKGAIIGLVTGRDLAQRARIERHVCVDTTAAGGNAQLLAADPAAEA